MKTTIIVSILILLIVLITGFYSMIKAKTETQKYSTIYKQGDFEIRYYPVSIYASVKMKGTYDEMRSPGFRVLAGYIFGGNEKEMNIAMTSPVRMSNTKEESSMSFIMPSDIGMEMLPKPNNENIILHESKPVYTASVRFGGYANDKEIEAKKAALSKILKELNLTHAAKFEYLGYNPPYQIVNRRNEIQVELSNFNAELFQQSRVEK